MINICHKVFLIFGVQFYGLVIRKEIFSESSHRIETHIDAVVEVLEFQISFYFDICLDDYFI